MTLTYNDELKICRLYLQDPNICAIKMKTGRSRDTIRKVLRREGLYNESGKMKKDEVCQWISQKIQKGIVRVKDYRSDIENRLRSLGNEKHHIHLAITGQAGIGKSCLSLYLARLIDPSFDTSGVVFDRSHLIEAVSSSPFKVLILDAAEGIAPSQDWRSNWMKNLYQVVAASRHRIIDGQKVPLSFIFNMPNFKDVAAQIRKLFHFIINIDLRCGDDHIHALVHDPNRSSVALGKRAILGELCYRHDEYDESLLHQFEKISKQRSDVAIELYSEGLEAALVRLRHDKRRIKREINTVKGQLKEYREDVEVSETILMLEDLLEKVENVEKDRMTLDSLYSLFKQKLPEIHAKLTTCSFNNEKNNRLARIQQEIAELKAIKSDSEFNGERIITLLLKHFCGIRISASDTAFLGINGILYQFMFLEMSCNLQRAKPLFKLRLDTLRFFEQKLLGVKTMSNLNDFDEMDSIFRNPDCIIKELLRINKEEKKNDAKLLQNYSDLVAFLKSFG